MSTLLKFGIGADSSTFGFPHFATPRYQIGFFKMGFAENLSHYKLFYVCLRSFETLQTDLITFISLDS